MDACTECAVRCKEGTKPCDQGSSPDKAAVLAAAYVLTSIVAAAPAPGRPTAVIALTLPLGPPMVGDGPASAMTTATQTRITVSLPVAATSAVTTRSGPLRAFSRTASDLLERWRGHGERARILRFVQPSLIGLIDGTISTLAPIFATAFLTGSHAALLVGLAASLGAAISMGLSEALSDDGELSGRGSAPVRGALTGVATFVGGTFHTLPFLISDTQTALKVAYAVVGMELISIAWVRRRFLQVPLHRSLIQVTLGGCVVAGVGALIGHV